MIGITPNRRSGGSDFTANREDEMTECPQGTCDAMQKIKDDMITSATVKWAVGIIVIFILAFAGAWGKTQTDMYSIKSDVKVAEARYENIEKSLNKIDSKIERMLRRDRDDR